MRHHVQKTTMFSVLLLGAGRSASALISYLYQAHLHDGWRVTIADASLALATAKTQNYAGLAVLALNLDDKE